MALEKSVGVTLLRTVSVNTISRSEQEGHNCVQSLKLNTMAANSLTIVLILFYICMTQPISCRGNSIQATFILSCWGS